MPNIEISIGVVGAGQTSAALRDVSKATEELGTKSTTAGAKFGTAFSGLKSQVGAITAVVGSGVMLFNMYDRVTDAQERVMAANVGLERANLRVAKAHDTLVAAIAKYGAGSAEAAQAAQAYNIALGRQEVAANTAKNANEDLGRSMADFAQNILPALGTAVGSIVQVISNMKMANAAKEMAGLGTASIGLIGNIKAMGSAFLSALETMGTAISGFMLRHPALIVAIVAIGIAVLALRSNLFGITDRLNEFGKAIGDRVPQMRPLLDILKQAGEMIGIFGTKTQQASHEVSSSSKGVIDLGTAMAKFAANQAAVAKEATTSWNEISAAAAKVGKGMEQIDIKKFFDVTGATKPSEQALERLAQAQQVYTTKISEGKTNVDAMAAAMKVLAGNTLTTKQNTEQASGALSQMISTAKWLAVPGVVQGPLGSLMSAETLKNLHLTRAGVDEIKNSVTAIPTTKTVDVKVKVSNTAGGGGGGGGTASPIAQFVKDIAQDPGWTELQKMWDQALGWQDVAPKVREKFGSILTEVEAGFNNIGAAFAKFKWPTLPEFVGGIIDIGQRIWKGSGIPWLIDQINGIKWPELPKLPTVDWGDIGSKIWTGSGLQFLWSNLLGFVNWLTLIKLPKPEAADWTGIGDTLWKNSGLEGLKTSVENVIEQIGVAFTKLKPGELQSRFGDIRVKFTGDTSDLTAATNKAKEDIHQVPSDYTTELMAKLGSLFTNPIQEAKGKVADVTGPKTVTINANTAQATQALVQFKSDLTEIGAAIAAIYQIQLPARVVKFSVDMTDIGAAIASVYAIVLPTKTVPISADASQFSAVMIGIQSRAQNPIVIPVTADASSFAAVMVAIQYRQQQPIVLQVTANISSALMAIQALRGIVVSQLSSIQAINITVRVSADTSAAYAAIQQLSGIAGSVTIRVFADVSAAMAAIQQLSSMSGRVTIFVGADISQAMGAFAQIANYQMPQKYVFVFVDTSQAQAAVSYMSGLLRSLPSLINITVTVGAEGGIFMIGHVVNQKVRAFLASLKPVAGSNLYEAGGKQYSIWDIIFGLSSALGGKYLVGGSGNKHGPYRPLQQGAALGGSYIVDQPTRIGNLTVGEGYRPEILTYIPLPGTDPNAAAVLIVTPLKGKNRPKETSMAGGGISSISSAGMFGPIKGGSNNNNNKQGSGNQAIERLISAVEKLIMLQSHGKAETNLYVDGQRMASVAQRYIGNRSYGDR